jgi:SAM-dependent methyltransferase
MSDRSTTPPPVPAVQQPAGGGDPVERFEPELLRGELVEAEHLVRYHWAAGIAHDREALDAGCGVGYGSAILVAVGGARRCVGVDIAEEAIATAREVHASDDRLEFEVGDVTALPHPDDSFDLVTCFETVEHVSEPDQERLVSEFARVLRPGGLLLISSPNRAQYPPGNPFHERELAPSELEALAGRSFSEVTLFRQHNWLASAILDDADFAAEGAAPIAAGVGKLQGRAPGEELYTLAACSDLPFSIPPPKALLTHGLEVRRWLDEIELHKRGHVETRKALAAIEQELLELRDHHSITVGQLEQRVYWLERWNLDLDRWMQRRSMRLALRVLRFLRRIRRGLARS